MPSGNATRPHWWLVNIGFGDGFVLYHATRHYLNKCWPGSIKPYDMRPQWVNYLLFNLVYVFLLTYWMTIPEMLSFHNDVVKWKHFPCYCSFVWGILWSLVNSSHKGQWCGALMFSSICAWINGQVNNHEAGELRHHRAQYDVAVM